MATLRLFYATNRNHLGKDRWHPKAYGTKFSDDGMENLRFGQLTLEVDDTRIDNLLSKDRVEELSNYLEKTAKSASIQAYPEQLDRSMSETLQKETKLGSQAMFADLKAEMEKASDVLVYIHGFNVSWHSAVGSALALQLKLARSEVADSTQSVSVVLFTWPSDGMALPFTSYRSDRSEAAGSGSAFGRGLLKVRDYLQSLRRAGEALCEQDIHLLCHSMGNYLLEHVLERMDRFTPGDALPRIFEHIFLCAPDVDDSALESGQGLSRVHEIARSVSIYHNRNDQALVVSDYTKGNPERLGSGGAARPSLLHNKVHQIDCTAVVTGVVEHSYYLFGPANADIRQSIDGVAQDDPQRRRAASRTLANVWTMA